MIATRSSFMRIVMFASVALVASSRQAAAEDDAFKRGLQAREDKNWSVVATAMRRAIEDDGQESVRKVKRNNLNVFAPGTTYVPYYFLGEALYQAGDCNGAIDAWTKSRQQGVISKEADYSRQMQAGLTDCTNRGFLLPDEFVAVQNATRQALREAHAVAQRVSDLGKSNVQLWQSRIEWPERYERASAELQSANTHFETGVTTRRRSEFIEANAAAARAVVVLSTVETAFKHAVEIDGALQRQVREASQLIDSAEAREKEIDEFTVRLPAQTVSARQKGRALLHDAKDLLSRGSSGQEPGLIDDARRIAIEAGTVLSQVLDEARGLVREERARQLQNDIAAGIELFATVDSAVVRVEAFKTRHPEQSRADVDKVRKQVETARRRFDQARAAENVDELSRAMRSAADARAKLEGMLAAFGPLTLRDRGVSSALEEGARLFLAGDYENALSTLEGASFDSTGRLEFHAHLLRAASLYTLFVRSGERNQALLDRARAAAGECHARDASFEPDARIFSKRFVAFFKNQSATPAETAAAGTVSAAEVDVVRP